MRGIATVAVLLAAVGCGKKPEEGGADPKPPERPALTGRIELEELAVTYRTNEAAAEEKYGNRRVTVEGTMMKLTKVESGYVMSFEHGSHMGSELPVAAHFPASAGAQLAKMEFRSPVLFSGRCEGWQANTWPRAVALRDCKIEPWPKRPAAAALSKPPEDDAAMMKAAQEKAAREKAGKP